MARSRHASGSREPGIGWRMIEPIATWTSPRSGAVYPARWRLTVPSESIELEVRPVLADQELDLAFRYWEGAVDVTGTAAGRGYVELTGYGPAPGS